MPDERQTLKPVSQGHQGFHHAIMYVRAASLDEAAPRHFITGSNSTIRHLHTQQGLEAGLHGSIMSMPLRRRIWQGFHDQPALDEARTDRHAQSAVQSPSAWRMLIMTDLPRQAEAHQPRTTRRTTVRASGGTTWNRTVCLWTLDERTPA